MNARTHLTRHLLHASLALTPDRRPHFTRCPNCGGPAEITHRGGDTYSAPTCCHSLRYPPLTLSPDQIVRASTMRDGLALARALPEPVEIAAARATWERV